MSQTSLSTLGNAHTKILGILRESKCTYMTTFYIVSGEKQVLLAA